MRPSTFLKTLLMILCLGIGLIACTEYDHDTADTKANRAGYVRHLGVQPSADVSGIYYYADEFGADSVYQLRFLAANGTVEQIIQSMGLSNQTTAPNQAIARDDLPWWPTDRLVGLLPYSKVSAAGDLWQILWHDSEQGEVFYLEFSL